MKTYQLKDVLKTEDIYHIDEDGIEWANYNLPNGQIGCVEVGTLHEGEWLAVKDGKETTVKIIK